MQNDDNLTILIIVFTTIFVSTKITHFPHLLAHVLIPRGISSDDQIRFISTCASMRGNTVVA